MGGSHSLDKLERVHDLATASWIDEPGSAAGVDLGTWIGEPAENRAWELLGQARDAVERARERGARVESALAAIHASEGSDWFWWFGEDQDSGNDQEFDDLFRRHLRQVYRSLERPAPRSLDEPLVPRRVLWTFTRPVPRIRHEDRISIRTNCPGTLFHRLDDGPEQVLALQPVGGVMAGSRRFDATLGPFPATARHLVFRFRCACPGCCCDAACCRGIEQEVAL